MPKFAVYYITPADSLHYQRGSEILGYDVRAGKFLPSDNPTRSTLPEFDESWIQRPQTYGFHITTGYSLYCEDSALPHIEAELESVCQCFGDVDFVLNPADEHIVFWQDRIAVLHYQPNINMAMLHTMITARVNPLATDSNINRIYQQKASTEVDPTLMHRVDKYYTPYMLDGWTPHFTLMMPYLGEKKAKMKSALIDLFPADPIQVESICLLYRKDDETHYRLHREYLLAN